MAPKPATLRERSKIGLLAGGGLSSWAVARLLADEGHDLTVYVADVDQKDEPLLGPFLQDMQNANIPTVPVNLREEVSAFGFEVARYDAQYDNGYWNSTGALRKVLLDHFVPRLLSDGCDVLAHGCVGQGNDQRRFDAYTAELAPHMPVYAPWLDPQACARLGSRDAMVDYLAGKGVTGAIQSKRKLSVDGSLLGVSCEGLAYEDLSEPWITAPHFRAAPLEAAQDAPAHIRLEFEGGALIGLDGDRGTAADLMTHLDQAAGTAGVGRISIIETKIDGTKFRGIYEAPALTVLGAALAHLRHLILSGEELRQAARLSRAIGAHLYNGNYLSPKARQLRDQLDTLMEGIDGEVEMCLYRGNVFVSRTTQLPAIGPAQQARRFATGGGMVWA